MHAEEKPLTAEAVKQIRLQLGMSGAFFWETIEIGRTRGLAYESGRNRMPAHIGKLVQLAYVDNLDETLKRIGGAKRRYRTNYESAASRIDRMHIKTESGCWEWTGRITRFGYGQIKVNNKSQQAHRVSYELVKGPIPEGFDIDHICRNRKCINPDHLEAVTRQENIRRTQPYYPNRKKTHCKRGHEFTEENTAFGSTGHKQCKACSAQRMREYHQNRKLKSKGVNPDA